jgi:hypothetical protein
MSDSAQWAMHHFLGFLRFYVAITPQSAEELWQMMNRFEQRPSSGSGPIHWYRYAGELHLTEIRPDRSGQWHADGKLPEGVDPSSVVVIPLVRPIPTVLDNLLSILRQIPANAPNREQTTAMMQTIEELGTPQSAARLARDLQMRLAEMPSVAEEQIRFLEQVSERMLRAELHEGRVRGSDVAGLLMVREFARTVAWVNPQACAGMLSDAVMLKLSEIEDLATFMLQICWNGGLSEQLRQALDWLRGQGDKAIETARLGMYPDGEQELQLEIYYGSLLKSLPYLLAAMKGYYKLSKMPNLSEDDREVFARRHGTADEKAVRVLTALYFAVLDVDGSRLAEQRAFVQSLLKIDRKKAEGLVNELVDLQFFYPPAYKPLLMGDEETVPGGGSDALRDA